jgi:hypothetical protein
LYNNKGHMLAINGYGNKGWKPLQQGIKEYLFCESCEQHLNTHYERPFLSQWVRASQLPDPFTQDEIHWVHLNYAPFKLFHLTNLFRASVASDPACSEVSLGRHEETIRRLLLNREPGGHTQYPIFGYAVVHHETNRLISIVSRPHKGKFGAHTCYGMIYAGVHWWISVSSHRNFDFEQCGLQPDGGMPFHAVAWNEIPIVQCAAHKLRNPAPSRTPHTSQLGL